MWYSTTITYEIISCMIRLFFSGFGIYFFTAKMITYNAEIDTAFFFWWFDLTADILSGLGLIFYVLSAAYTGLYFVNYFTPIPEIV